LGFNRDTEDGVALKGRDGECIRFVRELKPAGCRFSKIQNVKTSGFLPRKNAASPPFGEIAEFANPPSWVNSYTV
jgi:hypothetical protein